MTSVDAAILWNNGKAFFFKGGEYVRYDQAADHADAGYPKPIASNTWPGVPFTSGIDAALMWKNGKAFFFKGSQYVRYDIAGDHADPGYPEPIAGNWAGLPFTDGIDAAVLWNNGKVFFFKGSQYVRYDVAADKADPGYPKPIAGNWPGLPYASGVDAVLMWKNGKAHFFRGTQYVRYDIAGDHADPGYPKPIAGNWPGLESPAGGTVQHFPKQTPTCSDHTGSTTASASAKVSRQANQGLLEVFVHVKRTGVTGGTGHAYAQAVLLDAAKNTLFKAPPAGQSPVHAQAGPVFPAGINEKDAQQDFVVPLDILNHTAFVAIKVTALESSGLPGDIEEFTNDIKALTGAISAVGEAVGAAMAVVALFA